MIDRGDERLATAGSGDVLAGMVVAMLASGVEPLRAAASAAWMHGEAARALPDAGLLAGDLVELLPFTIERCWPAEATVNSILRWAWAEIDLGAIATTSSSCATRSRRARCGRW